MTALAPSIPASAASMPLPRRAGVWLLLAAIFFAACAPMLSWLEFTNTLENLNIATALEIRRTGHWLEPTLEGELRTKKPPLVAWITAAAIRRSTLDAISSRDPAARRAGFDALAWDVRWPTLLAGCLALAAVFELARALLADEMLALAAALIAGSSCFFLRYARVAGIDIHLMLWVTAANAFAAHALFSGRRWSGCLGAGAAAGLAFMCKGPVALVQSVLPAILFLPAMTLLKMRPPRNELKRRGGWIGPILAGALVWSLVALPWYLVIFLRNPHQQGSIWFKEVTGSDAPDRADRPWVYLIFLPWLFPWLIYFLAGFCQTIRSAFHRATNNPAQNVGSAPRTMISELPEMVRDADPTRSQNDPARNPLRPMFALWLIAVPLLIMIFFKDRKDRYLLPLLSPAAVLAAEGLRLAYSSRRLRILHWILLGILAIGLPITGLFLHATNNGPWYPPLLAAACAAFGLAIIRFGFIRTFPHAHAARPRSWRALVVVTTIVMLLGNTLFLAGYRHAQAAHSDLRSLAERIWQAYPTAELYTAHPEIGKRLSTELSIYLNRTDRWISPSSLAQLPPTDHARLAFMVVPATQPPHPPAGWTLFEQVPRGSDRWDVIVLPPAAASSPTSSPSPPARGRGPG